MAVKSRSQIREKQMENLPSQEHVYGTVTHVHDRRITHLNIVICVAPEGDDKPESLPITYSIAPSHEQGNLPEVAASVTVGNEVDAWYVTLSSDSPIHLEGQTLKIIR
jgi:hypothetical protein